MVEPDPATQDRIREAAERLFAGRPMVVTSDRLSVVELAEESGVDRARFYREYRDLKDWFLERARQITSDPPPSTPREVELGRQADVARTELQKVRERLDEVVRGKAAWKEAAEAAFRIVNLKEREIQRLETNVRSRNKTVARLEHRIAELESERNVVPLNQRAMTVVPGLPEDRVDVLGDAPSPRNHDED